MSYLGRRPGHGENRVPTGQSRNPVEDRSQRSRQPQLQPPRKDSLFGDDENSSVHPISATYVPAGRVGNRVGAKPTKTGKTVALPSEKGKAFGDKNGKRQKRTFEDRTNYRNIERDNTDDSKRIKSSQNTVAFSSKTEHKPMAVVMPQAVQKPPKQPEEKDKTKQMEKVPNRFLRAFRSRPTSGQVPLGIPRPKMKVALDLSDIGEALEEVPVDLPLPDGVEDIDADDRDLFSCPEYSKDIIKYTKGLEGQYQLPDNFAEVCPGKGKSRAILNDWLIQVQNHLHINQQTLHLTVAMLDIYLTRKPVSLSKLQLLGVTCLLIATKYEERFTPSIEKLLHLTDNSYVYSEVIQWELRILNVLKCSLNIPTPILFLERGMKVLFNNPEIETISRFLLDLALPHVKMVQFPPSVRAAAAIYLANQIQNYERANNTNSWICSLSYYLACEESEILTCAIKFAKLLVRAREDKFQGARDKFGQKCFSTISKDNKLYTSAAVRDMAGC